MEKQIERAWKGLPLREKIRQNAAEGLVFAKVNPEKKVGVVVEVNSETDFVAKNADFQAFVETCADAVIDKTPQT